MASTCGLYAGLCEPLTAIIRVFPNLAAGMIPDGPNQLWVADLSYIAIALGLVIPADPAERRRERRLLRFDHPRGSTTEGALASGPL